MMDQGDSSMIHQGNPIGMTTMGSDVFMETKDFERFAFEARKNPRFHNLGDFYFFEESVEKTRVFHLNDWSCAGVLHGKQLACAFNNGPKGQGAKMLMYRVALGGRWLNCDGGPLGRYYENHGFRVVGYGEHNVEFFPENWDSNAFGTPFCFFMAFNLRPAGMTVKFETWDEAEKMMEALRYDL